MDRSRKDPAKKNTIRTTCLSPRERPPKKNRSCGSTIGHSRCGLTKRLGVNDGAESPVTRLLTSVFGLHDFILKMIPNGKMLNIEVVPFVETNNFVF
jgi:hypothetical protein